MDGSDDTDSHGGGEAWQQTLKRRTHVSGVYCNCGVDCCGREFDGRDLCIGREPIPRQEQPQHREKRRET
jgi:hypothetical protein